MHKPLLGFKDLILCITAVAVIYILFVGVTVILAG